MKIGGEYLTKFLITLITSVDTKLPLASAKTLSHSTCLSVEWEELENQSIVSSVKEMWKDDAGYDNTCAVAAPTGLAAYNVGETTVHRLF